MKCFSHKSHAVRHYGAATLLSGLLLMGGLALKPIRMSNAGVPTVLAGNNQEKVQATAAFRVEQRQEQSRQIRPENFDLNRYPVTNANEKHWRNLLWTTAVVQAQDPFVGEAIADILSLTVRPGLSDAQKRTIDMATQVGTQLYLSDPSRSSHVGQQFSQTIERSTDPEWVAMSLSALTRGGMTPEQMQGLAGRVKARFPSWSTNVSLQTTLREMAELISPSPMPPLKDLLNWTIAAKQVHLYVFCQQDRTVLCQTVLKDRNGAFVRQSDGRLWSVPLLLRSIHGLGWNFVRGETPQGIFRMEGVVPQPDDEFFRAYGQFSLVNLFVPFEAGAKQFLPGKSGPFRGSQDDYKRLLPSSWRNYWAIQESYWAGKAGRSFFRIHGTGESPDFFSGKERNPYSYNWNPTIGCLSALELYTEGGQLLQADMPKILDALETVGGKKFAGYLVVVDLPGNGTKPIALDTIEAALRDGRVSLSTKSLKALQVNTSAKDAQNVKPSTPQPVAIAPTLSTKLPAIVPSASPDNTAPILTRPKPLETPQSVQPELNPTTRRLPVAY